MFLTSGFTSPLPVQGVSPCRVPIQSDPGRQMSTAVDSLECGAVSSLRVVVMEGDVVDKRERSGDSAWIRPGPTGDAAPTAVLSRQFASLQQPPTTNGTSTWKILPLSRVSAVDISRPQPCLALQYCCDPEHTCGRVPIFMPLCLLDRQRLQPGHRHSHHPGAHDGDDRHPTSERLVVRGFPRQRPSGPPGHCRMSQSYGSLSRWV